jgi:hypothetical protein
MTASRPARALRSQTFGVGALLACAALLGACGDGRLDAFAVRVGESLPSPATGSDAGAPVAPRPSVGEKDSEPMSGAFPGSLAPNPADDVEREPQLIDDLEDGDTHVVSPYPGFWYDFGDGRGEQSLEVVAPHAPRPGSRYALHTVGAGFRDWGAGIGLALGTYTEGIDASAFEAIAFWARVDPGSEQRVDLHLLNPDRDGDGEPEQFALKLLLTTEWRRYVVSFTSLRRYRGPVRLEGSLDPSQLVHVQFLVLHPDAFSVWIDDVTLLANCRACGTHLH